MLPLLFYVPCQEACAQQYKFHNKDQEKNNALSNTQIVLLSFIVISLKDRLMPITPIFFFLLTVFVSVCIYVREIDRDSVCVCVWAR